MEKIGDKWREGDIAAGSKRINKRVMLRKEGNPILSNVSKEVQGKRWYCLLALLCQTPEGLKPYVTETTPAFGT